MLVETDYIEEAAVEEEEAGAEELGYRIIYADPPWMFDNYNYATTSTGKRAIRGVRKEYPTLSVKEIAALPVQHLCAPSAACALWIPSPLLPCAFDVLDGWGFEYKTVLFNWIKGRLDIDINTALPKIYLHIGNGSYTRPASELCLLGMRGHLPVMNHGVQQVLLASRLKHSSKPAEARKRLELLFGPTVSRIELFARERVDGWGAWGDEIAPTNVPADPNEWESWRDDLEEAARDAS